ncbi:hypothetical protein BDZ89DRAFT_1062915 [Hymenopellis radicata]|nr:hypothetical protein BDZ89DRAFT_1062915 [Hymenopellis radicata]
MILTNLLCLLLGSAQFTTSSALPSSEEIYALPSSRFGANDGVTNAVKHILHISNATRALAHRIVNLTNVPAVQEYTLQTNYVGALAVRIDGERGLGLRHQIRDSMYELERKMNESLLLLVGLRERGIDLLEFVIPKIDLLGLDLIHFEHLPSSSDVNGVQWEGFRDKYIHGIRAVHARAEVFSASAENLCRTATLLERLAGDIKHDVQEVMPALTMWHEFLVDREWTVEDDRTKLLRESAVYPMSVTTSMREAACGLMKGAERLVDGAQVNVDVMIRLPKASFEEMKMETRYLRRLCVRLPRLFDPLRFMD